MFTQKKKSFFKTKTFFAIILVLLAAFGLWMNNTPGSEEKASVDTETNQKKQESISETSEENAENADNESIETESSAYYLVKEVEGAIKVFYHDEDGTEKLYMTTGIPFDLMNTEDQKMLTEGIVLKNKEELDSFLENFDS